MDAENVSGALDSLQARLGYLAWLCDLLASLLALLTLWITT